jgi:hypothetical protein
LRQQLTNPDIEEIYKHMLWTIRVHGWESIEPKQVE